MGAFGEKLRKQRELRGIELDAISNTTKISTRMLRALEDEHFDQLPGGVFNKGFVRAYARQVGLDEEEAISDYLAALRESQIQSQTILPNFRAPHDHPTAQTERAAEFHPTVDLIAENSDRRVRPDDRRQQARRSADREVPVDHGRPDEIQASADQPAESLDQNVPSPSLSFLNLDSAPPSSHFDSRSHPEETTAPISPDAPSRRVPWEKLAVALVLITLTLALLAFHRRSHSAAASRPGPSPASPVVAAALTSTASSAATPSLATKPSASSIAPANHATPLSDPDVNPPLARPYPRATTPRPPPRFTLVIRADQTAWVSITADGQPVAQETLIAPANTSVRASHEIVVKTGNAAGISFLLGGKDIPTQGNPGEVRTFTFDANGMQTSAPSNATH